MPRSSSYDSYENFCAAWIGYINQVHLDSIIQGIATEEHNLKQALLCLNNSFHDVQKIIHTNRGDSRGIHGFIAEASDVGIRNALNLVDGRVPNNILVDNNGPVDIIRNGIKIQQKFSVSGNSYSLNAARAHLEKYPWFLDENGRYQIPRDHFETIKKLLEMSESEAARLNRSKDGVSYRDWRRVHEFFATTRFNISDFEPSVLNYRDAQKENIGNTFTVVNQKIRKINNERKESVIRDNKGSHAETAKIVVVAGAFSGITSLVRNLREATGAEKSIGDLTSEEWLTICQKTGLKMVTGSSQALLTHKFTQLVTVKTAEQLIKEPALRHIAGFQKLVTTPAMIASGMLSLSYFVVDQARLLHSGKIGEAEFIDNCLWSALEISIGTASSLIGQAIIPIPVLGPVLGGIAGSILLKAMRGCVGNYEQGLIQDALEQQNRLDAEFEESYSELVSSLKAVADEYFDLLSISFDPDPEVAFLGSQRLAEFVGVPPHEILRTSTDIDNYFLS